MPSDATEQSWFVLRDLRRHNARKLAYEELEEAGFEVFVPLTWRTYVKKGREIKRQVPAVCGLLFVHSSRDSLNPFVNSIDTLQYRYVKGAAYCSPMTVRDKEMDNFIALVSAAAKPCYYQPGEVTPKMVGSKVRLIGGPMDGREGRLMKVRGSSKRRLYVEVSGILGVSVVIHADSINYIEIPDTPKGETFRAHAAKARAAAERIKAEKAASAKAAAEEIAALQARDPRVRYLLSRSDNNSGNSSPV